MQITRTKLAGVAVLEPKRFGDDRGFFSESWNRRTLLQAGLELPEFVQDNHSFSTRKGTVRGLHFQSPPHAQGKLVRCGRGALLDVAVDIRRGSPTYGEWVAEELSFENGRQLWIPAGFLHGFVTLSDDCEIIYKCTDHYAPECDGAVHWASASLGIEWGITSDQALLSPKDAQAQDFADFDSPFTMESQA
ncbi:dTDP-4-dehydrorhamnose 3,5-epimerase [Falsigemmobacter faecalis]|uniref:dTDP-4-dehydrorhamnose 3,5-epimerase n=1 Tax=Falsigemmobacter faecalis TaxID=2488730 RepID=A0A3P3D9W8_9RHOB|nr:dTDP-4-dehydrorhamnose 3,5-epimerase [Falsigemmobacter faecalis]RRH71160.1 dTDP-4-dehydrorhamnose 3,5-epimerase [Falsigemmobacter faecalis]